MAVTGSSAAMAVAAIVPVPAPIPVTMPIPVLRIVRRAIRLIANGRTRDDNSRWANGRNINPRRAIRRRRSNHDTGQGRKRKTDSDADVDPGVREGQATYENRCN